MANARILIVEDDAAVASSLSDCLQLLGWSVSGIAPSGEEALLRAAECRPDLALMDIKLQGAMDGVGTAKEIQARFDIPVIYLTGYSDDGIVQRAAETGPYGFIVKPYGLRELKSTIEIAIHKHAVEQKLKESEARYRSLVEHSVQALVVVEGMPPHIVLANAPCAAITGYSVEELLSLSAGRAAALIHPDDREWLLGHFEELFAGRPVPPSGELRILRRDGSVRWVAYFSSVVEHSDRVAVQAAFVDITERKNAEKAMQSAHGELEKRVQERTVELARANELLKEEVAARLEFEEALQRRNRELQMIYHVAQELSSCLDLDRVTTTALSEARHLLNASGCTIWLIDPDDGQLTCWQAVGPHSEILTGLCVPEGEGLVGWVAQHKENLLVTDTRTDDRHFKDIDARVGIEARCILSIPLEVKQKLLGILQVVGETPACFDEDDVTLLKPLAASAAIAIENALLHEQLRREAEELEREVSQRKETERALRDRNRDLALLNRVIEASAESQTIGPILTTVCRELALAFDVPDVVAVLLDEDGTRATTVVDHHANGRSSAQGSTLAISRDPSILHLVEHKAPLVQTDLQARPTMASSDNLMVQSDTVSLLAFPLTLGGEVAGGVGMSTTTPRRFSAGEVELAQRVGEQVSGALARARLVETQQRLSAAVEQAAEAVLITDADGNILYVNPAFEQTTGYTHAEVAGQNLRSLKNSKHHAAFYGEPWVNLTAGQTWKGRLSNQRKDGTSFLADATIAPVRNQAGEIVNYAVTMHDVTHMVELEEQFHHAQKMEALGRLAGGIAHDFGNLLTVVQMSAAVLLMQIPADSPIREPIEQIQRTGERAKELTQQLLRFGRRDTIKPHALDLNRVIRDMSWVLECSLGRQIRLSMTLAEDLGAIEADPSQLQQAIMNLVFNARDAMPDGGTIRIETSNVVLDEPEPVDLGGRSGPHVLLAVSDTGVGMDDRVKSHLFQPFFTTKEPGRGTGLGLSTVQAIVKQSGGQIQVESEPGQGATFRLWFPCIKG
jgi:PAS domain S-box-containing protein